MASTNLEGKVAIVTGGSRGIGRATATLLAQRGAKVVISYSSDTTAAEEVIHTIGAENALAVKANAGSVADNEKLVTETVAKFGKIDIVIANAGVLPYKDLDGTSEQDFDDTFNLNVKGPYFLVQKAVPYIPAGGKIILISTTLTQASTIIPHYLLYLSTKGAVEQMVRGLARNLAAKEISVNAVSPGPTDTALFHNGMTEPVLNYVKGLIPRGRLGTPEEIAEVLAFFSSDASSWVTGQVLRVNGGMA